MTTLLLLVALPAFAADDNPEPPAKKGIHTRLVAKKKTYKLDLGGRKADDYLAEAKKGTISPPSVELELVITNYTKEAIRIRATGSTNRLTLTLKGDGAVNGTPDVAVGVRPRINYVIINPGEKHVIPIASLSSNNAGKGASMTHHYWTSAGEYTLSASFYTLVTGDPNKGNVVSRYETFTAKPISIKVEK